MRCERIYEVTANDGGGNVHFTDVGKMLRGIMLLELAMTLDKEPNHNEKKN